MSVIAIILGASSFQVEGLESSVAFTNAKASFVNYLTEKIGLSVKADDILDLFDSQLSAVEHLTAVRSFLIKKNAGFDDGNHTLVFYYVGHGFLRQGGSDLYWAIARTEEPTIYPSALNYRDLFELFKSVGANLRIIGVIDCCYAATARGSMSKEAVQATITDISAAVHSSGGYALLCSASSKQRAYLLPDDSSTVFTDALVYILRTGWGAQGKKMLTPHEVVGLSRSRIASTQKLRRSTPEIYDVGQEHGLLSTSPFFPVIASEKDEKQMPSAGNEAERKLTDADRLRAFELHRAALELLPLIASCLRTTKIHVESYAYIHRVKAVERIVDKVKLRIADGISDYGIDSVTDILGLRIISLFNEDLHSITMEMLDIMLGDAPYHPNPLRAHELLQIKIYTTAPVDNPTTSASRLKRRIVERLQRSPYAEFEVDIVYRSDYSSIHMVAYLNGSDDASIRVPVEVQIRTVFEDTWSRIDHVLRYSRSREKRTVENKSVPVASERHLITLKALLDACANFAETIRDEMSAPASSASFSIKSLDGRSDFEKMARTLGVEEEVAQEVSELIKQKDAIDDNRPTGASGHREIRFSEVTTRQLAERYELVAEKFGKKLRELSQAGGYLAPDKLPANPNQFIYYTIQMEEAYCRVLSNQIDEQKQAQRIYLDLAESFDDIPVLFLRLGQASVKVGDYAEAMKSYERALRSFQSKKSTALVPENWQFTQEQRDHIALTIHRVYGFACWRMFEELGKNGDAAVAALRKGWEVTFAGLGTVTEADSKLRLINNLLSYYDEIKRLEPEVQLELADVIQDDTWLAEQFAYLRGGVDLKTEERLEILDTLVVVADRLNENEYALAAANRTVSVALMEGSPDRFGRKVCDETSRTAWDVIIRRK